MSTSTLSDIDSKFTIYANAYKQYTDTSMCLVDPNCPELVRLRQAESDFKNSINSNVTSANKVNNYQSIMSQFHDNKNLQNTIETELTTIENSNHVSDSKFMLDTTIFTGISWALIATGILYYIIVEL